MYTDVSSSFLSKIAQPSRHFEARFYNGSTLLDLEILHIEVTTGTCGGSNLAVGCAFAGYLTVSARYTDIQLEGKELKLELGLLLDDSTYEYIPFGYWTVQKPTVQNDIMSFTAVDRMASKFNEDYSSSLTYPATIANVLSELSTATGVTINCNLQTSLQMPVAIEDMSQRGALAVIANCLLACAWVDRNGMVNITAYGNSSTQATVDYDYVKEQPNMDEKETLISGVKVYTVDGQTDTWIETGTEHMVTTSNVYTTQAMLDATANNIVGLEYNGGSVKFMGNPLLDPSDTITFNDGEADLYVPCMEITQSFDGGLLTTVTAPGSFEVTEKTIQTGPIAQEMERRARATAEAQATADEALTTAEDAATAAEDAMVLATGKSKIFYSATAPTSGMSSGDMWMKLDGSNALYQYSGSTWTLRQFGQGSIVAGSITTNELYGNTISALRSNLGTITAGILQSYDYDYGTGPYFCQEGLIVNLNSKIIMTPKFSVIGGVLRATDGIFSGTITAKSGTIGGYTISSASNTGTTANGGHVYTNSLYTHSSDSTYEYESGLAGGGAYNNAAFYIRRIEIGDPWSSSDYMFYVRNDGYLYATKGSIAGSLITRGIDASNITAGTISASVIAANSISVSKLTGSISRDNWVIDLDNGSLTIGNISADNINAGTLTAIAINNGNGTFSVTAAGALTASNATITGSVTANSGLIGGFSISSTSNTGTTASGGHHYTNSLYVHSTGTEGSTSYEYEAGLTGNNSSTAANFYVRRIASGAAWSTSELRFFVRNDGYLMAITGKIGPWTLSETSIYKGGGYQSSTAGSAYFGDSGLSVTDKFYVDSSGNAYITGELHVRGNGKLYVENSNGLSRAAISYNSTNQYLSISTGNKISLVADEIEMSDALGETVFRLGMVGYVNQGFSLTGPTNITGTTTINGNTSITGTLQTSDNINIVNSSTTSVAVGVQNSVGKVQLYMSGSGNMGVYDATNSKYIIYKNSSGQTFMSSVLNDTTSSAGNLFMGSNGRIYYGGGSSKRYKKEIKPLTDWKSVLDIPVVSFKYRDNYLSKDDQRYGVTVPGFIAEEVDEHYSVAADRVEGKVHDWNARYIIPPMLAVEQDHEKRIRELEDEIRRLKGEVA